MHRKWRSCEISKDSDLDLGDTPFTQSKQMNLSWTIHPLASPLDLLENIPLINNPVLGRLSPVLSRRGETGKGVSEMSSRMIYLKLKISSINRIRRDLSQFWAMFVHVVTDLLEPPFGISLEPTFDSFD